MSLESYRNISAVNFGDDSLRKGARVNEILNEFRKVTPFRKLTREGADLFWSRNLSGEQEPEHALGEDLLAICSSGKFLLAIWDGQSMEADTLEIYSERLT